MTDILMNLISDMKVCLAAAIGTGLIFGYLYTKLKARELYKPNVKNFMQKIDSKQKESENLLAKNSEAETEIKKHNDQLHEQNLETTKLKNQISELESNKQILKLDEKKIKDQYKKQENIYNDYNHEVQTLKTTLGVDDITNIENHKASLKEKAGKMADLFQEKCNSYDGLYNEEQELDKETSDLTSKISSLDASLNKKEFELSEATKSLSNRREKLQLEIDNLLANKNEYESNIEHYKKQLLEIKKNL